MEPAYHLNRLSVAATIARRATSAETRLIRSELPSFRRFAAGIAGRAGVVEPLWPVDQRSGGGRQI
jgi:hypothetical protein